MTDEEALRAELGPHGFKFARGEVSAKLKRAERGQMTLTTDEEEGEVYITRRQPKVFEIPVSMKLTPDFKRRHIRVYFTEPADVASELLLLLLKSKADGKPGLDEQDAHIDLAAMRGEQDFRFRS